MRCRRRQSADAGRRRGGTAATGSVRVLQGAPQLPFQPSRIHPAQPGFASCAAFGRVIKDRVSVRWASSDFAEPEKEVCEIIRSAQLSWGLTGCAQNAAFYVDLFWSRYFDATLLTLISIKSISSVFFFFITEAFLLLIWAILSGLASDSGLQCLDLCSDNHDLVPNYFCAVLFCCVLSFCDLNISSLLTTICFYSPI